MKYITITVHTSNLTMVSSSVQSVSRIMCYIIKIVITTKGVYNCWSLIILYAKSLVKTILIYSRRLLQYMLKTTVYTAMRTSRKLTLMKMYPLNLIKLVQFASLLIYIIQNLFLIIIFDVIMIVLLLLQIPVQFMNLIIMF